MKTSSLLLSCLLASAFGIAQNQEISERTIKSAYLHNQDIFKHPFSPVSELWDKKVTLFNPIQYNKDEVIKQLSETTELRFIEQNHRGEKNVQYLSVSYEWDDVTDINVSIKPNLTDKDNQIIEFSKEAIINPYGNLMGNKEKSAIFILENKANSRVKGNLSIEYQLLTNRTVVNPKPEKNNSFSIANHQFQFLEVGENYLIIKGKKEELKNLGVENLSNDKKILIAPIDFYTKDMNISLKNKSESKEIEEQIKKELAKRFIKSHEIEMVPEKFVDPSIKNMSLDAFKTYYEANINEFKNSEQVIIINFFTKIENLYLYYNNYDARVVVEKNVNEKIKRD